MAETGTVTIKVEPSTVEFDRWLAQIDLLLHKLSFAIDGYLLTRPDYAVEKEGRDA